MLNDFRMSRSGVVCRALGISALAAILFVAGCTSGSATFTVTTTSGQLATVIINAAYPSTTLTASNGTAPYTWAWSGNTPPGLTLTPAGVLSGTPSQSGTFNFTVTVTDSATPPHTATANLSILINPALASVALNPTTVTGGTTSTGTVTLNGAAAAAASVTLSSNNAAATVPATVTVAAGATSATFQVTTSGVTTATPVTITGTYGVAKTAALTVNAPTVQSLALTVSTITGGGGTTGTVTLSGPAATGGDSVTLSSNNAAVTVPATVTVAAGQTAGTFNITTTSVTSNQTAQIQGSFNSSSQSANLTLVPAPVITSFSAAASTITSGKSTTLTAVFSNGTGSVNNAVGTVTSAVAVTISPTATTTYTLTVTNAAGTSVTQQTTVTVVPAPVITSFTAAAGTITAGNSTTLTAVFSNGTGSVDNGVGTVTSGTAVPVTPATTTTYTLTVTNSAGTAVTQQATVTVVPAPVITSFTAAQSPIVIGNSTTLTAVFSNGTGSVDNSVGTVTSGTPVSVQPTVTTTYTLTVTNTAGTKVTAQATVTVDTPPGISSANTTTFTVGSSGSFLIQGTGNPLPTFLESGALPSGVTFTSNSNGTATLQGAPATGTDASSPYNITITASNGVTPNYVQNFSLVVALVQAPSVTTNPTSQTVTAGNNATFTAAASGAPAPTVQWQISTNGGTSFSNITGATSTTLNLTAVTLSQTGYQYRAVFTNSVNSATTTAATLTVVPAPTITSFAPAASTITSGTSTTLTAVFSAGTGGNGSVDNGVGTVTSGTPVNVAPSSTTTYTLTVTNAAGTSITQQTTVTVVPTPVITSFTATLTTIVAGNSTTITPVFNSGTGISATIDNNVGAVTSGTGYTVSPLVTTTYTLTVSNTAGAKTTQQVTITVDTPPGFSSNNSVTFTEAVNQSFNVQTTGTPAPSIIESGALPNGVSFTDNGNGSGTLSGTPASGTSGTYSITFTAHNGVGTDATQNFTLTIIADPCTTSGLGSGNEAMLNGHYAFLLKGFDNGQGSGETMPQPALVGGVLTFNGVNSNGLITAGILDQNLNNTAGVLSQTVTSGTYKVGSDRRGCMAITTSSGTQHYRFSLGGISGGVASTGHMIDFDPNGPYTEGYLREQDTTAFSTSKVTGNYIFEISAPQNTSPSAGGKQAAAGILKLSAGTVTGGEFDLNDEGELNGSSTLTNWPATAGFTTNSGGSYTIDATTGRGTVTSSTTVSGTTIPFTNVIYVVSSSDVLILTNFDQTQSGGLFGAGEALQQASGPFSNSSLNGTSVIYLSGLQLNCGGSCPSTSSPNTSNTTIGTLATEGSGSFTVSMWQNNSGTIQNSSSSGTYSIDSNGRVTLSGAGNHPPLFYIVSSNKAYLLGGSQDAETGMIEPQSSTSITSGSTFAVGGTEPEVVYTGVSSTAVTFTSSTNTVAGTSDDNSSGSTNPDQSISMNYSVNSSGLGSIGSSGCTIGSTGSTGCQLIFYVISATRAVIMELLNDQGNGQTNPTIQFADE